MPSKYITFSQKFSTNPAGEISLGTSQPGAIPPPPPPAPAMKQHNPFHAQVNPEALHDMWAGVHSVLAKSEEVLWLSGAPFQANFRYAGINWLRGDYVGRRSHPNTTPSPYEQSVVNRFKEELLARQTVEEFYIAELSSAVGSFVLRANGHLQLNLGGSKSHISILFYGYYRGPHGVVFRVKPSHQEKWERAQENWSQGHKSVFQGSCKSLGRVYELYRQVLDQCAEYQYAKTLP